MSSTWPDFALKPLAEALSSVAGRLQPKEATQAIAYLTQTMSKTKYYYPKRALARALAPLQHGWSPGRLPVLRQP